MFSVIPLFFVIEVVASVAVLVFVLVFWLWMAVFSILDETPENIQTAYWDPRNPVPVFFFTGKIHQTLSSKIRKILTGIIPWSGHFSFVFYVGYCQKGVSVSCQYLCLLVGQVITLIRCLKCLKSIRLVSLSQFSSKLLFKALFVLFVMFQTSRQSLEYKGISWNFWQTLCLD